MRVVLTSSVIVRGDIRPAGYVVDDGEQLVRRGLAVEVEVPIEAEATIDAAQIVDHATEAEAWTAVAEVAEAVAEEIAALPFAEPAPAPLTVVMDAPVATRRRRR
jgi:hypothetical protein